MEIDTIVVTQVKVRLRNLQQALSGNHLYDVRVCSDLQ